MKTENVNIKPAFNRKIGAQQPPHPPTVSEGQMIRHQGGHIFHFYFSHYEFFLANHP